MKIGDVVYYYKENNVETRPDAATVLDIFPHGILRLGIMPRGGGEIRIEPTVYNTDDPKMFDERGLPTQLALRNGGWKSRDEERVNGSTEKILNWAKDSDYESVCRKARSLGMSKSDVAEIYETSGVPLV